MAHVLDRLHNLRQRLGDGAGEKEPKCQGQSQPRHAHPQHERRGAGVNALRLRPSLLRQLNLQPDQFIERCFGPPASFRQGAAGPHTGDRRLEVAVSHLPQLNLQKPHVLGVRGFETRQFQLLLFAQIDLPVGRHLLVDAGQNFGDALLVAGSLRGQHKRGDQVAAKLLDGRAGGFQIVQGQ